MHIARLDTYGDYVNTVWWVILNGFIFRYFKECNKKILGPSFLQKHIPIIK